MLFAKKKKLNLKIDGMHCEKCVGRVMGAVREIGGSASVDLKLGRAVVTIPEKVSDEAVCAAISSLGFGCTVL